MKKLFFTSVLVLMFASLIKAQTPSSLINTYMVGTSKVDSTATTGLVKRLGALLQIYNSAPVYYMWLSGTRTRPYVLWFHYKDCNLTEMQKYHQVHPTDTLKSIYMPRIFFDSISPQAYDLDQIMATDPTGSGISTWAKPLNGKYVYFIDRSDMTTTQVKLIPVEIIMVLGKSVF